MVKDIFLFATLRTRGIRHYYQPWTENLIQLLDDTYQTIQKEKDLERKKCLTVFSYEIGKAEIIPLILSQGGDIPNSWRSIEILYKKYFSKLLKKR